MKHKLVVVSACATLFVSSVAYAKDYVLTLSPMQSHEALHQQTAATLRFLVEHVKPGESALIVDGLHLKTIAQFAVKDNKAYDHPKAKMQLNRKAVIALRQFADNPVKMAEHGIVGVMQVPQLLQFLGQNYGPFQDTDIIILASPIYVDARDPNWGMVNNHFPGDGHFNAAPQDSPFSLQGRGTLLSGTRIHWAYPDTSWISSEGYRINVTRVWTLLTEGYGSQLSTFTGDQATLWQRAAAGVKATPHGFERQETNKIETIQLVDESQQTRQVSIYERELSNVPPSKQVMRQAQNVEIGISWQCEQCDLDLHVRPHHGAEVLFFGHRQSEKGHYHKDFLRSPKTDGGYETVTLTSAVDLRDVLIAINWYGGKSPEGVDGEIRLAISDDTYALAFTFSGASGNGGNGASKTMETNQPANKNWLIINPKEIVGL